MYRDTKEYRKWKVEVQTALDDLVAENFSTLYTTMGDSEYYKIWRQIRDNLYRKYELLTEAKGTNEIDLKAQQRHYIKVMSEIYSEEIFPYELFNERTMGFVEQHGKLPNQLAQDWKKFQCAELNKGIKEQKEKDDDYLAFLRKKLVDSKYVYR